MFLFYSSDQFNQPQKNALTTSPKILAFWVLRVYMKMADFSGYSAKSFRLPHQLPYSYALSLFLIIFFKCVRSRVILLKM